MVLLNLGPPRLLLCLELQRPYMLPSLPYTLPGSHQRSIRIAFGSLGHHDALASLHDGRVDVVAGRGTVAEGARQQAALALSSVSGVSAGGAVAVRSGGVGGRPGRGRAMVGTAEEGVALGCGFLVDWGRGRLGLGVAGEEGHVDACCVVVVVVVDNGVG